MSEPTKTLKKIKIRRKKINIASPSSESQKQKSLKIAKKASPPSPGLPTYNSIQEDFIFENEENPLNFLSTDQSNPRYDVISKSGSISPTLMKTPTKSTVNQFRDALVKPTSKYHLNFSKFSKRNTIQTLEQRLSERSEQLKQSMNTFRVKPDTSLEKKLLKQTKSLENYKRATNYWEKLEQNIADTLETNPEDLRISSGKKFVSKQHEKEVIEKFNKINEISDTGFWKNTLRNESIEEKFFKNSSREFRTSLKLKSVYTKKLARSPNLDKSRTLKESDYFKQKLKSFPKYTEELLYLNQDKDFLIQGTDKIKLEYEAASRIGKQYVNLPPLEPYTEQIISKNYEPKTLY